MRRRTGRAIVVVGAAVAATLTLLAPTSSAHPAAATTSATAAAQRPVLRFGMQSPEVAELQAKLGMPLVTGYFGPITLMYVREFQRVVGLRTTGVVNRRTWKAVNRRRTAPPQPTPPPATGSRSPVLGAHPTLGPIAAPMTRFRDGGHAYYKHNGRLHSCRYRGRCMDLNGAVGQPVYAMADGQLVTAPYAPHSYGNFVTIKHRDGTESIYAHLAAVTARPGPVTAGTQIGTNGCSGTSGEPNGCKSMQAHLHLEWSGLHWKRGEYGELPPFFDRWRGTPQRCYQGC